jgi:S1-C subfamily serine protease
VIFDNKFLCYSSGDVFSCNCRNRKIFFFGFPFEEPNRRFFEDDSERGKVEKQQVSSGSGFIVTSDGLVITNRHVVANTKAEYTVVLGSGKTYDAEVLERDTVYDLAVVRIKQAVGEKTAFPTIPLGDSDKVQIGQTAIAIGYTLGEFKNTVTRGIVSGINRTITAGGIGFESESIEGALQTDAAISSGNSGGPLLNSKGEVIGVNTAVSPQGENIGFALPVNQAKLILESIKKYGKIVRPWLGVRYLLLNEEIAKENGMEVSEGALVVRGERREDVAVVPGSPADKAGLRENDVILEVDGRNVGEGQSLQRLIAGYKAGDAVILKVYRAGKTIEVKVTLESRK